MKGFISYCHDDHAAFREMRTHLRAIERTLGVNFWADNRLNTGNYWSGEIAAAIIAARVHILIFSPAFIGSDYIFDHELPAINAKCADGDLVLPVIVNRCAWASFVGVLQAAPKDATGRLTPIIEWRPQKNGFDAAREQIGTAISDHFNLSATVPFAWGRP
jgi:hypothetical protein